MSLAIVKVDREKRTHSIYAEGRVSGGNNIITENNRKVFKCEALVDSQTCVSILGASIGSTFLDDYLELKLPKMLCEVNWKEFFPLGLNIPSVLDRLIIIYNQLWTEFCTTRNISLESSKHSNYSGLLSINGNIFHIESYDNDGTVTFLAYEVDKKFDAIGAGDEGALALLTYGGIDIYKIFETMAKLKSSINANVFAYDNIPYNHDLNYYGESKQI
jgi:hypothetical protein